MDLVRMSVVAGLGVPRRLVRECREVELIEQLRAYLCFYCRQKLLVVYLRC
jgi:hypothetical protein